MIHERERPSTFDKAVLAMMAISMLAIGILSWMSYLKSAECARSQKCETDEADRGKFLFNLEDGTKKTK